MCSSLKKRPLVRKKLTRLYDESQKPFAANTIQQERTQAQHDINVIIDSLNAENPKDQPYLGDTIATISTRPGKRKRRKKRPKNQQKQNPKQKPTNPKKQNPGS